MWRFCDHPRRQLASLPRTYFEVKDVRPNENQGQVKLAAIFVSTPRGVGGAKPRNTPIFVDVGKIMNEPRVSGLSCFMINGSGEALFNVLSQSIVRRLLED